MGRGEGEGSVGAADMARGVGSGLGVVRTVRVIAVLLYIKMNMSIFLPSIPVDVLCFMGRSQCLTFRVGERYPPHDALASLIKTSTARSFKVGSSP